MKKWKKLCEELPEVDSEFIIQMSYERYFCKRSGNLIIGYGKNRNGDTETLKINMSWPVCDKSIEWCDQ